MNEKFFIFFPTGTNVTGFVKKTSAKDLETLQALSVKHFETPTILTRFNGFRGYISGE